MRSDHISADPARRSFIRVAGASLAAASAIPALAAAEPRSPVPASLVPRPAPSSGPRAMKKAVKIGMVNEGDTVLDKFKLLKDCGFDGVELDSPSDLNLDDVKRARDATGIQIPGVVDSVHWSKPLSDADPAVRDEGRRALEAAIRDCHALGGTSVLLVPAVVRKGVSYAAAYERSQAEIRKVLPLAAELKITIALENVWNQFLLSPLETARYIDELNAPLTAPLVAMHFDPGNVVNFGYPEHWIEALGHRVVKLDVKEFSRKKRDDLGLWKGFDVELMEGDTDWPAVMRSLDAIGYTSASSGKGWAAAEIAGGGRDRLTTIAKLMDKIFAS